MSFFGSRRQSENAPQNRDVSAQKPQTAQAPVAASSPQVGFETVLGASSALEGALRSSANIRLDGTFTGTLEINGNVLIGETAKINADVNAKNISIAGAVRGNVNGKKVQILRTGRVWGDIRATALTTEEGAFIDGKITMVSQEPINPPDFGALFGKNEVAMIPTGDDTMTDKPTNDPNTSPTTPDSDAKITESLMPIGMGATEDDPEPVRGEGAVDESVLDAQTNDEGNRYAQDRPDINRTESAWQPETDPAPIRSTIDEPAMSDAGSTTTSDVESSNSDAQPMIDTQTRTDMLAADYGQTPEDEIKPTDADPANSNG